jgi:hypothetical protein
MVPKNETQLTNVTEWGTYDFISLIEGRLREGTFGSGASAVPPRGLATRSGAALGIIPFGITAEA